MFAPESFDVRALPADFYDNPFPYYRALRERDPVHRMPDGVYFLTRYADILEIYRDPRAFSSDKRSSFIRNLAIRRCTNTTPPAWCSTILRCTAACAGCDHRPAPSPKAIAAMEAPLVALVDRLLDAIEVQRRVDLIPGFAAAIPVEVIGNLLACRTRIVVRGALVARDSEQRWSPASRLKFPAPEISPSREFLDYLAGFSSPSAGENQVIRNRTSPPA